MTAPRWLGMTRSRSRGRDLAAARDVLPGVGCSERINREEAMTIPSESASTSRLLRYARYHIAAVAADPKAAPLGVDVSARYDELKARRLATEGADEAELATRAMSDRADLNLDEACRACELAVLGATGKDRGAPAYALCFPQGLSALVAARGESQTRAVAALINALESELPALLPEHGARLAELAAAVNAAETAARAAEDTAAQSFVQERASRARLVRQLHANRGGLRALYPRRARLVRSYFPASRRDAAEPGAAEEDEGTSAGSGASGEE